MWKDWIVYMETRLLSGFGSRCRMDFRERFLYEGLTSLIINESSNNYCSFLLMKFSVSVPYFVNNGYLV